jgi:hypothetical protein
MAAELRKSLELILGNQIYVGRDALAPALRNRPAPQRFASAYAH